MLRLDMDDHTSQNRHLRIQALREPDMEEVVPQIEVGGNHPHVGLAQSHKDLDMQDPRRG
jgi:hypothetical protein